MNPEPTIKDESKNTKPYAGLDFKKAGEAQHRLDEVEASSAVQPPNTPLESKNEDEILDKILDICKHKIYIDLVCSKCGHVRGTPEYDDSTKRQIQELITKAKTEARLDELIWSTGVEYKYDRDRRIIQDRIQVLQTKKGK